MHMEVWECMPCEAVWGYSYLMVLQGVSDSTKLLTVEEGVGVGGCRCGWV